ncbi:MAG: hypothetical protein ACXVCE_03400, partial [Bacteriovorax sp.]
QAPARAFDYGDFLFRLGFKDYSGDIEKTLSSGAEMTEVSKEVLIQNKERYQIVNDARELTLNLIESVLPQMEDPEVQDKLIHLTSFLLSPHPLVSLETLPENISKLKVDKDAFLKAREAYLSNLASERAKIEKDYLLTTLVDLNPTLQNNGEALRQTEHYLNDYVSRDYSDLGLQQTRYWGRALAACLVRYSRLNAGSLLEKKLSAYLKEHNLFLENFISNNLSYVNANKQISKVTLHSGDMANEYSRGTLSYYITIGVVPGSSSNKKVAQKNRLLGRKMRAFDYPSTDEEESIKMKATAEQTLTEKEKRMLDLISVRNNQEGFSHAGLVDVKKDEETNIQMPWIWDLYPNASLGGVRFIGPEGFAFPANYQKVGYVHYSPEKYRNFYKTQIQKRGYMPNVWKSYLARLNRDNGELESIEDHSGHYNWPTLISEKDVQRIANDDALDAATWFERDIAPRISKTVESYMTSSEALSFTSSFANARDTAYCSQLVVLAYLQGIDVDAEATIDSWSTFAKTIKHLNVPGTENIDLSQRIVAPAGFAWQSQLVENFTTVQFDHSSDFPSFATKMGLLKDISNKELVQDETQSLNLTIDVNDNDY